MKLLDVPETWASVETGGRNEAQNPRKKTRVLCGTL